MPVISNVRRRVEIRSQHGALMSTLARAFRVIAVTLALSSCAVGQSTTASFEQISLSRTQCYGRCPVYSVLVRADGSVAYTGGMHVKALGARTATVSAEDLDLLRVAIRIARLHELRPNYVHLEDGCTRLITDLPSIIITARVGGLREFSELLHGLQGAGRNLRADKAACRHHRQGRRHASMGGQVVRSPPNPSINRTSNGLRPSAAGYVKR